MPNISLLQQVFPDGVGDCAVSWEDRVLSTISGYAFELLNEAHLVEGDQVNQFEIEIIEVKESEDGRALVGIEWWLERGKRQKVTLTFSVSNDGFTPDAEIVVPDEA